MNKYNDKLNEIKRYSNQIDDMIIDLLSVKKFLRTCDSTMFADHKHEYLRFYGFANKRVDNALKTVEGFQSVIEEKIDED